MENIPLCYPLFRFHCRLRFIFAPLKCLSWFQTFLQITQMFFSAYTADPCFLSADWYANWPLSCRTRMTCNPPKIPYISMWSNKAVVSSVNILTVSSSSDTASYGWFVHYCSNSTEIDSLITCPFQLEMISFVQLISSYVYNLNTKVSMLHTHMYMTLI